MPEKYPEDRKILLVEDDPAVAAMIAELLEDAHYVVDGPHTTLADGISAVADEMPDGAVLDVRLGEGDSGLLADDLDLYDIPYVFCAGAFDHQAVHAHPAAPLISKSDLVRRLVPTLRRMLH
ncbi:MULTISPECIES: response regulator transcription factor [Sphingobium]|jgi:CheY-like chemotaxis protein|uniref:DNA-binding response regulator n=1 Tax=Sphingomonas sanxanigenens TaxID=397260 RepID=A0A2W5A9D7_9SPHN|nr:MULTISPECIES: response regulator transcription factor [Sphingobium]PZO90903.1 MAG: DNA-binding response regulator [Sphingomonas sanxanigenens]